jgi:molybdopterin biosynthesis enzyme
MKQIKTTEAVGHVLCHDMTRIIPGTLKETAFRKGHIVTEADIPVLLSMGKENLFVWEKPPGMLHEDEGAARLLALCGSENMIPSEPREGKIELTAAIDGYFSVDAKRLNAVNRRDEVMIATRHAGAVRQGDKLAGMRVIPLVIAETKLAAAAQAAGGEALLRLRPYRRKTAAIIATGNEVASGRVKDGFTPVVERKLTAYGIAVIHKSKVPDDRGLEVEAIQKAKESGAAILFVTGGMSVDPDDLTPGAIRASGAHVVCYGAPVLPGAMLLVGYYSDGVPVLGLPGCVMYSAATIFDLLLPRLAADIEITRDDIAEMGYGGLCLGCDTCRYPVCPFGKQTCI